MRKFFIAIFLYSTQLVMAQDRSELNDSNSRRGYVTIPFPKMRNFDIVKLADSINEYKGRELPSFLIDKCVDLRRQYWPNYHLAISIRWEILEKVNNKFALKAILNRNDARLKCKCSYEGNVYPYIKVPLIQFTTEQLIRKRYQQLQ